MILNKILPPFRIMMNEYGLGQLILNYRATFLPTWFTIAGPLLCQLAVQKHSTCMHARRSQYSHCSMNLVMFVLLHFVIWFATCFVICFFRAPLFCTRIPTVLVAVALLFIMRWHPNVWVAHLVTQQTPPAYLLCVHHIFSRHFQSSSLYFFWFLF